VLLTTPITLSVAPSNAANFAGKRLKAWIEYPIHLNREAVAKTAASVAVNQEFDVVPEHLAEVTECRSLGQTGRCRSGRLTRQAEMFSFFL
jgi:hypothetical protein